YSLDLLDVAGCGLPGGAELAADAAAAAEANAAVCRVAAGRFRTYSRFWGLSAGDGPGDPPAADTYRCYAPRGRPAAQAHGTAAAHAASLVPAPALVWETPYQAGGERRHPLRGRYGFSNINLDRSWVGGDVVGIDAGAAALHLDNCLFSGRVRRVFQSLAPVA